MELLPFRLASLKSVRIYLHKGNDYFIDVNKTTRFLDEDGITLEKNTARRWVIILNFYRWALSG